jgi:hypothetical protein
VWFPPLLAVVRSFDGFDWLKPTNPELIRQYGRSSSIEKEKIAEEKDAQRIYLQGTSETMRIELNRTEK